MSKRMLKTTYIQSLILCMQFEIQANNNNSNSDHVRGEIVVRKYLFRMLNNTRSQSKFIILSCTEQAHVAIYMRDWHKFTSTTLIE